MYSRILFPTALHPEEDAAFHTALRLALGARGSITLLHVGKEDREHVPWDRFPPVRKTLEKWDLLPAGSAVGDVHQHLGLSVRKLALHASNVTGSVQEHMEHHGYDLVVMGTEARSSWGRLLRPSKAEPIAEAAHRPTLFVPRSGRSPVHGQKAELRFQRLLVPVRSVPDASVAIPAAMAMAACSLSEPLEITLLHVGEDTTVLDHLKLPDPPNVTWHRAVRSGSVKEQIANAVDALDIDLVVMATNGVDSLKDDIFGTTTEQTLHTVERPVLAVPHPAE
ncbi:MAG: universal stress protein [Flavobacteriales bacterium]|nr:universal stress protein [Flavobacteriales bacterium]